MKAGMLQWVSTGLDLTGSVGGFKPVGHKDNPPHSSNEKTLAHHPHPRMEKIFIYLKIINKFLSPSHPS